MQALQRIIMESEWKDCYLLCFYKDDEDNESVSTRDDEEGDSASNVPLYCEELISAVLEMKDSHGRIICQLFKKLPPRSVSTVTDFFYCNFSGHVFSCMFSCCVHNFFRYNIIVITTAFVLHWTSSLMIINEDVQYQESCFLTSWTDLAWLQD